MGEGRQVVIAIAAACLVLGALATLIWRALPPVFTPAVVSDRLSEGVPPFEAPRGLPSVLPAADASGIRYAIIEASATAQLGAPEAWSRELALWRAWLTEMNAAEVAPALAQVLVVPDGRCLGTEARIRIRDHLLARRGLITTGALGSFDGACRPAGDALLPTLLGGEDVVTAFGTDLPSSIHAILVGESVLGAGVPAGARIEFYPEGQLSFAGAQHELYYTGYDRVPLATAASARPGGAAVRARIGDGRLVAFGFALRTLPDEWSQRTMRLVVANALRWSAGEAIYQLASWPDSKRAAVLIAQDVEADFHNARNTIGALAEQRVPATAFIVESLAERDRVTTNQLSGAREIGTHTYSHLPLDTMNHEQQLAELARSKGSGERLTGRPVTGMRPPQERYNRETLEIWAALGGEYVFTSNQRRVAAPEILPFLPDSLVLLGRVVMDDFEILETSGLRDLGEMSRVMLAALDDVLGVGGLFAFSYHSHLFGQRALAPVVTGFGQHVIERDDLWVARGIDIARWWRARAALRLEPIGAAVRITNTGPRVVERAVLLADLPDGTRRRHALPPLQPGETRDIQAAELTVMRAER